MAAALKALGKLSMTEQELRRILKERRRLGTRTCMRTLLQLSYVPREFGDLYLAAVMARECLARAVREGESDIQAGVLNTLGNIHHDEGEFEKACDCYRQAQQILSTLGSRAELRAPVLTTPRGGKPRPRRGDPPRPGGPPAGSDALASRPEEAYHDILFLNSFRRWEMA